MIEELEARFEMLTAEEEAVVAADPSCALVGTSNCGSTAAE